MANFAVVAKAMEESWQMLAGTPLHIAQGTPETVELPGARYFSIGIHTADGREHTVVLQVSPPLLMRLTSAMFDEPAGSLSDEQCLDAGKELANILSSCCIKHIPLLENGQVDLPRPITQETLHALEGGASLAAHFLADSAGGVLCLSIIEPSSQS